jgi:hypothetical protein
MQADRQKKYSLIGMSKCLIILSFYSASDGPARLSPAPARKESEEPSPASPTKFLTPVGDQQANDQLYDVPSRLSMLAVDEQVDQHQGRQSVDFVILSCVSFVLCVSL